MAIIEKDQLFTISSEERDDFHIIAFCRALINIDIDALRDEYLSLHPQDLSKTPKSFRYKEFAEWVIENRFAVKVNVKDWHLGDYGEANFTVENWF